MTMTKLFYVLVMTNTLKSWNHPQYIMGFVTLSLLIPMTAVFSCFENCHIYRFFIAMALPVFPRFMCLAVPLMYFVPYYGLVMQSI